MEMLVLYPLREHLILLLFLGYIVPSDLLWIRESAFDNKSSPSGFNVISRSRIQCGQTCSSNDTCVSFFFKSDQHLNCQLHESVFISLEGLQTVQNAEYYVLDGATFSTTTSTPAVSSTTTPPPFSCPPDDTIFRTILLADGQHFTYKVVKMDATQSQAHAACATQGAFLARVTTVAKMDMLLQLTRTCSGYGTPDYYVDGSNAGASDYGASGAWVMANEDLVPMSKNFWGDTYPNKPHSQHCLRMRADIDHRWDDCSCSNPYYYICEK